MSMQMYDLDNPIQKEFKEINDKLQSGRPERTEFEQLEHEHFKNNIFPQLMAEGKKRRTTEQVRLLEMWEGLTDEDRDALTHNDKSRVLIEASLLGVQLEGLEV